MRTEGEIVTQLRAVVAQRLSAHAGGGPLSLSQRRLLTEQYTADALDAQVQQAVASGQDPMSGQAEARIGRAIVDYLAGAGGLQALLDDKDVENVDANGCDDVFVRYTDGRVVRVAPIAASDDELVQLVRTFASEVALGDDSGGSGEERTFDRNNPQLDLRLRDGSRLCAVMAVSKRPSISIRRPTLIHASLHDLTARGMLDRDLCEVLQAAMRAGLNHVFAGGTNTGKTTFARAAARAIDPAERLITIEDSYELELYDPQVHPNVTALQARRPNLEGVGAVSMSALVRTALRLNPSRVIVGEVRGDEVLDLLKAMSQGNDGSFATVHASSSGQAFTRLMMYAVQTPEQLSFEASAMLIAESVNLVVHLDWTQDKRRVVSSVREVVGFDGRAVISNEVWAPGPDKVATAATPLRAETLERLETAGLRPATIDRIRW